MCNPALLRSKKMMKRNYRSSSSSSSLLSSLMYTDHHPHHQLVFQSRGKFLSVHKRINFRTKERERERKGVHPFFFLLLFLALSLSLILFPCSPIFSFHYREEKKKRSTFSLLHLQTKREYILILLNRITNCTYQPYLATDEDELYI